MLGKIQKKHCPQVPKKLSYLKSLEIQKPQLILNIFTPATTGNGFFFIKLPYQTLDGKTVKNVQIDSEQRRYGQ